METTRGRPSSSRSLARGAGHASTPRRSLTNKSAPLAQPDTRRLSLNGNCLQRLVMGVAAFIVGILISALLIYSAPYLLIVRKSVLDTVRSAFDSR